MIYKKANLDYIFIRAKNKDDKWDSLSLNKITDKQFVDWARERFSIEIQDDAKAKNTPWTPEQKVDFLNRMSKHIGGKPVVAILKKTKTQTITLKCGIEVVVDWNSKKKCECGEEIYFALTAKKKPMPICLVGLAEWDTHFANCPLVKKFRKKK